MSTDKYKRLQLSEDTLSPTYTRTEAEMSEMKEKAGIVTDSEVVEAKRAIIRELRAGFRSFAMDGMIVITKKLWMHGDSVIEHVNPAMRFIHSDEDAAPLATLDEWAGALKNCLARRSDYAGKRVERLSREIERAKRILAVLKAEAEPD